MNWKYGLTILISIMVFSCQEKAKLKVEKYPSGIVKSEEYYLDDTIRHGSQKGFYPNGSLKAEINYIQNKKEGPAFYYFPNGTIKSKVHYVDDLLDGECIWYYDNGKIKSKIFWLRGREYGSGYFYNEQEQLDAYHCIDFDGNVLYTMKIDSGKISREEGVVFSPNIKVLPEDLNVNNPINFLITVAQPPGYSTTIWTRDFFNANITNRVLHPIENSTVSVEKIFTHPGKYGLIFIGELRNQSNTLVARDSIIKIINIKR